MRNYTFKVRPRPEKPENKEVKEEAGPQGPMQFPFGGPCPPKPVMPKPEPPQIPCPEPPQIPCPEMPYYQPSPMPYQPYMEYPYMPEYQMCPERLAHAYVPWQYYNVIYSPGEGLEKGTIFPELFMPKGVYGYGGAPYAYR